MIKDYPDINSEDELMKRRDFIKSAVAAAPFLINARAKAKSATPTFEQFLEQRAVSREVIDRWLRGPSWAQFDPEMGYVMGNYMMPSEGIDGSGALFTVQSNGARNSFMYAGRKCRINTYGDSFTECEQVNDGEAWQEYLAGHLAEPIRNFGVGGYGVYQSYRRMLREERTDHGAEYLIFFVFGDDHVRSLLRCRHAVIWDGAHQQHGSTFSGNFWPYLEMDVETGQFVEKENLLSTPSALYQMTEPQFMVDHLKDDLALQLCAFLRGFIRDIDRKRVGKLAACLNYPFDWSRESDLDQQVGGLLDKYSLAASQYIVGKAREFARQNGKQLLVVLFDPGRAMSAILRGSTRYDQEFLDFLVREKFNYFDMNEVQSRDYKKFSIPFDEYTKLYFVGHYNPRGNHFFAYSIKDTVVRWLDPKPITYQIPARRTS
jgi:hypothetical protein